MNKITKYITTGASALLMLMSVGAVQNNVNASKRHYRVHTARYVKKNVHRHGHSSKRAKVTNKQFKQSGINKRNKKVVKKALHKKRARKTLKRNQRRIRKHANQLKHRRYHSKQVLKPRYRIVPGNKRGNRALRKSGFYDGQIIARMGYSNDYRKLIFNKYAPNDKRAVIPDYMNPKMQKVMRKSPSYHNVNKCFWVQGRFDLSHPQKNTKNPKVYKYYPKLHGWKLAPKNLK